MKNVNSYNNFKERKLKDVSFLNSEFIMGNADFYRYQRDYNKIIKDLGINMHYSSTYKLSMASLFMLIKMVMDNDELMTIESTNYNVIILTTCAVSLIVREDKDNVAKLMVYAKEKGIEESDIKRIMTTLLSIKRLFDDVAKNFGKKIDRITDMLSYTELFVPFINVLVSIINHKLIDIRLISSQSFNELKDDDIKYKLLLNRIIHKLMIVVNNTSKFQNVKNSNILRVNDEFKSPMYKNPKIQM